MTASFQSLHANLTSNNLPAFCTELFEIKRLQEIEARQLIELAHQIPDLRRFCMHILSLIDEVPGQNQHKPTVEFVYRGCLESPTKVVSKGLNLGPRDNPTKSIVEHKRNTGSSVYVSCSKDLEIAAEFAQSLENKYSQSAYIYQIRALDGIDCQSWFAPVVEFHAEEKEVLFPHHIPSEAVIAYSQMNAPSEFRLMRPKA